MQFVPVFVPEPRVAEVYALLAVEPIEEHPGPPPTWQPEHFALIKSNGSMYLTYITMTMDYLARNPDTWVTAQEVAEYLGIQAKTLYPYLGAFTKWIKKNVGISNGDWPFEVTTIDSRVSYRMSAEAASLWAQA